MGIFARKPIMFMTYLDLQCKPAINKITPNLHFTADCKYCCEIYKIHYLDWKTVGYTTYTVFQEYVQLSHTTCYIFGDTAGVFPDKHFLLQ